MKKQFARQRTTAVSQDFILQTEQACQTVQVNSITMQVKNLRYSPADARRRGTLRLQLRNRFGFRISVFGFLNHLQSSSGSTNGGQALRSAIFTLPQVVHKYPSERSLDLARAKALNLLLASSGCHPEGHTRNPFRSSKSTDG